MHNASHDLESLIRVTVPWRGGTAGSHGIEGIGRRGGGSGGDEDSGGGRCRSGVSGDGGGGERRVKRVDSETEHGELAMAGFLLLQLSAAMANRQV